MRMSDWSSDCALQIYDPQNTPNDPAVKLTAELLGVPVDRIPRALEESDFLGQVFLTRREMQNPKAPRYMRKYQPTEADDIETSKHIIESALEHYVPTVRPGNEARSLARESGMTAAQIRKARREERRVGKGCGRTCRPGGRAYHKK